VDLETANALQSAVRMIDNVNDRSMLNGLSMDLTVIMAAALRRQALFSDVEVQMIAQAFANAEETWPEGRAEKARKALVASKAVWDAAEPH